MKNKFILLMFIAFISVIIIGCGGSNSQLAKSSDYKAIQCVEPTLQLCNSEEYMDNCVGHFINMEYRLRCREILQEEILTRAALLEEKDVLNLTGDRDVALIEPNPSGENNFVDGTGSYLGKVMEDKHYGIDENIRHLWESNGDCKESYHGAGSYTVCGLGVDSCQEYIYERYYDVSKFEDLTSSIHNNYRAVFEVAYRSIHEPGAIGSKGMMANFENLWTSTNGTLQGRDGKSIANQEKIWPKKKINKNIFFNIHEDDEILNNRRLLNSIPNIKNIISQGKNHYKEDWKWHYEMSTKLSYENYLDEKLYYFDALKAEFLFIIREKKGLNREYENLSNSFRHSCGSFDNPNSDDSNRCGSLKSKLDQINDIKNSINNELIDGLIKAEQNGCLSLSNVSPCDWNPKMFVQRVSDLFTSERENLYKKCIDYTDDNFDDLKNKTILDRSGEVLYEAEDYSTSALQLELFFNRTSELYNSYSPLMAKLIDPLTGKIKTNLQESGSQRKGNDYFSVLYDYNVKWDLKGYETNVCDIKAVFDGNFSAAVDSVKFGYEKNLISTNMHADFYNFNANLYVLGNEIFNERLQAKRISYSNSSRQPGDFIFSKEEKSQIPDNNQSGTTGHIQVNNIGEITGLRVSLTILHSDLSDLLIQLISPNGTSYILHNRNLINDDKLEFKAKDITNHFYGENGDGVWTIKIKDLEENDLGQFVGWRLIFNDAMSSLGNNMLFNVVTGGNKNKRNDKNTGQIGFYVMGLPIKVSAGLSGRMGLGYSNNSGINVDPNSSGGFCPEAINAHFNATFRPIANMSAFASASVDLMFMEAGIKGDVILIDAHLPLSLNLRLSTGVPNEGGPDSTPNLLDNIMLEANSNMDIYLKMLDGRLAVFADMNLFFFEKNVEKDIVNFSGLKHKYNLFNKSYNVPLKLVSEYMGN